MTPLSLENVVDVVADLLHDRIGLRSDQNLRGRLRRAISEEASRHRDEPTAYADRLLADQAALQGLLNAVTVQETGFFRHPEQFEVLANDVLPGLSQPVRIWSAGCANGQEAYSLAMVLDEQQVDGEIIATDLSTAALQRTAAGRYSSRELSGLTPERRTRHFIRHGDSWSVGTPIHRRVRTLHHNLLDPLPAEIQTCDVVFCRNVLIYLSPHQARLFLERIADGLDPSLTLFVGTSETIWQVTDRFKAIQRRGCFIYRPRNRATSSAPKAETLEVESSAPKPARMRSEGGPGRRTGRPGVRPIRSTPDPSSATARPARPTERPHVDQEAIETSAQLDKAGQDAIATGDYQAAVIAFRKYAYLRPQDPLAQLHLGLALEALGDERSARRAFAAARRALLEHDPEQTPPGIDGYSAAELLRFLDSRT